MMFTHYLEIAGICFGFSFLFALGGVGAAVAIVPVLVFLGIPFSIARPTGLFANFMSTGSATFYNLRKGLVDFKLALPLIIASIAFSPVGAYASHLFPEKVVAIAFTCFLFFAGAMVYIPKKAVFREESSIFFPILIGAIAGFVSGFLGVGGGGLISPFLIILGYNPKKVAVTTALVVPFSSFTGFLAYWKMGSVNWTILLFAAIPSLIAGYIASHITHRYLKPHQVKKLLGLLFFLLGIKFFLKYF
jgi:uncharacterized membrane protein YfcA